MKGPMNGTLEFIDTGDIAMSNVVEHGGMTDVEWDPTGRYVTTAISYWSQKMDTGFIVWSFQGNVLYRNPVQMEKFCQLLWRPRPPSPLSKDDLQTIKKEMKKYQMVFEQEDRSIRSKASKELLEKRTKLMKEHSEYRKRREDLMRDRKRIFLEGREQCTLTLHVYAYHAPKVCVFIVEENVNIGFALQKVLSGNACPMFSCAS
ncbi:Eukaryotic translation initiation factor 3 subunit B [Geodia barretti]|nr:Eukaryotic translation initiation factor 3 subunit B [Geodia barretti]